jgi:hypothetical protein
LRLRWDGKEWLAIAARLVIVGGVAATLLLPWVRHIAGSQLASEAADVVTSGPPPLRQWLMDQLFWLQITRYFPWWLLVVAGVAWILSIARRQWTVTAMGLWIIGLALLRAGRLINLPGTGYIQIFAVIIALYIPIGIIVGWLLSEIISWLLKRHQMLGYLGAAMVLAIGLGWGLVHQVNIVDSDYILVTDPDLAAMDWIGANTPEDARFLVNGFLIRDGASAVGSDAGWWIPLLANRQNTMPPQYALLAETPIDPTYSRDVVDLVTRLQETPLSSPEAISLLCQQDISHVFVGQRQGQVGSAVGWLAVPLVLPDELLANPAFSPLYHQDRVWVFAFDRSICPAAIESLD